MSAMRSRDGKSDLLSRASEALSKLYAGDGIGEHIRELVFQRSFLRLPRLELPKGVVRISESGPVFFSGADPDCGSRCPTFKVTHKFFPVSITKEELTKACQENPGFVRMLQKEVEDALFPNVVGSFHSFGDSSGGVGDGDDDR